jgi:hypothetical protein
MIPYFYNRCLCLTARFVFCTRLCSFKNRSFHLTWYTGGSFPDYWSLCLLSESWCNLFQRGNCQLSSIKENSLWTELRTSQTRAESLDDRQIWIEPRCQIRSRLLSTRTPLRTQVSLKWSQWSARRWAGSAILCSLCVCLALPMCTYRYTEHHELKGKHHFEEWGYRICCKSTSKYCGLGRRSTHQRLLRRES